MEDQTKRRRKRQTVKYKKISNGERRRLLELVNDQNYLLKEAAKELNIKYSSAKTILRIWRRESRICKKYREQKAQKRKNKLFKVINSNLTKEKFPHLKPQNNITFSLNNAYELDTNFDSSQRQSDLEQGTVQRRSNFRSFLTDHFSINSLYLGEKITTGNNSCMNTSEYKTWQFFALKFTEEYKNFFYKQIMEEYLHIYENFVMIKHLQNYMINSFANINLSQCEFPADPFTEMGINF